MEAAIIGKYKVAYWNPRNSKKIKSKMFDSFESLRFFEKKLKDKGCLYTIMTLDENNSGQYIWNLQKGGLGSVIPLFSALYPYRYFVVASILYYCLRRK